MKAAFSQSTIFALGLGVGLIVSGTLVVFAWTGPTATPPGNNVPAPINVGSNDQGKTGNISIGTGAGYLNFGTTFGTTGYGFRDNGGSMQYKDSGGAWTAFSSGGGGGGTPGPAGPPGAAGPAGAQGPAGAAATLGAQFLYPPFYNFSDTTGYSVYNTLGNGNYWGCPPGSVEIGAYWSPNQADGSGFYPDGAMCQWDN